MGQAEVLKVLESSSSINGWLTASEISKVIGSSNIASSVRRCLKKMHDYGEIRRKLRKKETGHLIYEYCATD